jgi:hypothetical protein
MNRKSVEGRPFEVQVPRLHGDKLKKVGCRPCDGQVHALKKARERVPAPFDMPDPPKTTLGTFPGAEIERREKGVRHGLASQHLTLSDSCNKKAAPPWALLPERPW